MDHIHQKELTYTDYSDNTPVGNLDNHTFNPVLELNSKYPVDGYANYYFIVREDLYNADPTFQRVCLYRDNVINKYLYGDDEPHTLLISNEPRGVRTIRQIIKDMNDKVTATTVPKIVNKYKSI